MPRSAERCNRCCETYGCCFQPITYNNLYGVFTEGIRSADFATSTNAAATTYDARVLGFGDMAIFGELRRLNQAQKSTFAACFLGWTLDAFDFFLLTVCLKAIAADFHVGIKQIAEAIF